MKLPNDVLQRAQATRATFGPGVKLLFVVDTDTGETRGNPAWDECRALTHADGDRVTERPALTYPARP